MPNSSDVIFGEREAEWFRKIVEILRHCHFGAAAGITLDALTEQAGVSCRRITERIMEERLADFPFAVVSGNTGYFRPTMAVEINRYRKSLRSRAIKMFLRDRTVGRKSLMEGFIRQGREFVDRPTQGSLALS